MKIKNVVYKLKEIYRKLSVPQFTIVTGLIIIFFGTLILSSPLCSSSDVGLWEAFFTSTSAITVTGLTIIDIGVDLNIFGQIFLAKKICPKIFKSTPISIIVKPVTVIAEVDVKKASHKPTSDEEHNGELKIKVPKKIIINPVTIVNWGTDNFLYISFNL